MHVLLVLGIPGQIRVICGTDTFLLPGIQATHVWTMSGRYKRPFHLQVLSDPSRDSRFGEVVLGGLISVAIYYLGNQQN